MTHLEEAIEPYRDTLLGQGWTILAKAPGGDRADGVGVHRTRKNGTVLKGADVLLSFYPFVSTPSDNPNLAIEGSQRRSPVPYRVDAKSLSQGKRFADLTDAIEAFLQEAGRLAPAGRI